MLSTGDVKVCLSTFEFTLFQQTRYNYHCPSCGFCITSEPSNEVRFSSLLLLLGIGSYVCYKVFKWKKRKDRKWRNLDLINFLLNGCEDNSPDNTPLHATHLTVRGLIASGYDLTEQDNDQMTFEYCLNNNNSNCNQQNHLTSTTSGNYSFIDTNDMNKIITLNRSYSLSSMYGVTTVNKIDQVLNQIEDIKKSVLDIDSDLHILEQKSNDVQSNKNLMKLTATSSFDEDYSSNQEYESPSLEWDSGGDVCLLSENVPLTSSSLFDSLIQTQMNSTQSIILGNELSFSSSSQILRSSSLISTTPSTPLSSPTNSSAITSPTASHSQSVTNETKAIKSSPPPSSEYSSENSGYISSSEPDNIKVTILQRLLDEAKRLGVFNDLVKLLNKKSKRDSAYSEE